ncbi:MAG: DUF4234 domain-containing protein [Candidatus Izemoplasmataceae bacterium]
MKERSVILMLILTFITFGLYLVYWTVAFQSELKKSTGMGFGGFGHFILLFITFGIYYIVWCYKVGERLEYMGGNNDGLLYLILVIFSLGLLTPFFIQMEANRIHRYTD